VFITRANQWITNAVVLQSNRKTEPKGMAFNDNESSQDGIQANSFSIIHITYASE
jgi:hypothetical protein